jgi:hypothetical protein
MKGGVTIPNRALAARKRIPARGLDLSSVRADFFLPNGKTNPQVMRPSFPKQTSRFPAMKLLASALAGLLGLTLSTHAQVALKAGDVKLGKVQPAVVKTPEFSLTSGPAKRSKLGDWLEVEVEYETKAEIIDELTFTYTIMVEKRLLTGQVTHINIPKGREHYSVMYVSPRTLTTLTGGRPLTGASIENVWVSVERQGMKLDQPANFKPGTPPNVQQLPGLVLNKDETPFAPLYYDRYEAIKKTR